MNWTTDKLSRIFKQILIFTFIGLLVSTSVAQAALPTNNQKDFLLDGDSFIPIPWGKEIPISWLVMSGSWMLRQGNTPTSFFTFKVINQSSISRILYIQQLDPKNCELIGSGVGNLTDSKVIYATLRNAQNREAYRVNLRNFSVNSFVKKVPTSFEGNVVMLSIAPINSYKFVHFSMARVNTTTLNAPACRGKLQ